MMIERWLTWLSCFLIGGALVFGLAGSYYWFKQPEEIACQQLGARDCGLPKGSFELAEQAYHEVGESLFTLENSPPALQIPDLKSHLIYFGKNGRPDAVEKKTLLHFAFNGSNKQVVSIAPGKKLYLVYERHGSQGRYGFSPDNQVSSLWIEATPIGNEAQVNVGMVNDKGEVISDPEEYAEFNLPEKEYSRYGGGSWEIGSVRADGTLLARQKAKWYGGDRFLEDHGGEDYKNIEGKQRIDFGEGDGLYSVFVKVGDCLIWDQNQWKSVMPGEESSKYPILLVKKVEERMINFELWDVEGKARVNLNLLKTTEPWTVQNAQTLQNMFKFLGAKTRTQCVFEINRERVILRPSDWLLLTPKGWKKLATEEEIDDYVRRRLPGTLFVFEGIQRKDERQMMVGTLYSPSRNESRPVELSLQVKRTKNEKDLKDKVKEGAEAAQASAAAKIAEVTQQRQAIQTQPPSK